LERSGETPGEASAQAATLMSMGLVALLDDVAALARLAAASVDDVAAYAGRAGAKSASLVIDDAAVTPRYVTGISPSRELPMIWRITKGSLRNKLLFLLPAAMALSAFAPWAITPLLMVGGCYLAYEGAEKVYEALFPHQAHTHEQKVQAVPAHPEALENARVTGAIRTDFILSAEIMAIALSTIPDAGYLTQAVVLALVGIVITFGVYGAVGLIVKADDAGVALVRRDPGSFLGGIARRAGWWLVKGMPYFLTGLAALGTAAMVWVGGGILVHGLAAFGWHGPEHVVEALVNAVEHWGGGAAFLASAVGSGVAGLLAGAILIPLVQFILAPAWTAAKRLVG
jgi:predicted DNA repair protein MutK